MDVDIARRGIDSLGWKIDRWLIGGVLVAGIKIFTDSAADLPSDLVAHYDIGVVPLLVSQEDRVFADGRDLTHAEFYQLLAESKQLPTTSQPSPQDFIEAYTPYLEQGQTVISINLSSGLSGTVESALIAQTSLGDLAKNRLHVVDSLAASVGEGLLVCLAADLAEQGKSAEEIVAAVRAARARLMHLFTLDTMENLVKGGRISRAKATLGGLLNIKPILWIDEQGKIDSLDKVRGRKKSLRQLVSRCQAEAKGDKYPYLGVCHANCLDEASEVVRQLQQALPNATVVVGQIGAAIGTHTGQGCIAIFYFG